ncbi:hypothetical protein KM043_003206 [Ampulex compressa]|nr:hypothetical protein KM043_003206 [Ampulex compressa]
MSRKERRRRRRELLGVEDTGSWRKIGFLEAVEGREEEREGEASGGQIPGRFSSFSGRTSSICPSRDKIKIHNPFLMEVLSDLFVIVFTEKFRCSRSSRRLRIFDGAFAISRG